jgi:hypothetical protein
VISPFTAAIATLEGKTLRNRVVNVIEALPLSDNSGMVSLNMRNYSRPHKKRERRNIIDKTPVMQVHNQYYFKEFNEFRYL